MSVFALGSLLCGLPASSTAPASPFNPTWGSGRSVRFVVAFLGGTRSGPIVVGLAGLFIGLVESLSGLFVSPQWSSLVVFSVLFIYLVLRPIDFRALRASSPPAASSPRG